MEILVKNILVKKNNFFSTYIKNGKQIFSKAQRKTLRKSK